MKRTVKITDVAEKAGVVKSTVSNVLTGKRFVSEDLRKKVLAACEELDFHPNFYASSLSGKKSNIIALLLESNDEVGKLFYQNLIISVLKQASKKGYSLLIYYNSDSAQLLNTLRQGMAPIDGAILMSPCIDDERIKEIEKECIDCVVIGRPDAQLNLSYVDIDNKKLVKDVCAELIARYGNEVYLINSDHHLTISQDRAQSFAEICKEYGIDFSTHLLESSTSSTEDGYNLASKVISQNCAVITANEHLASGVYAAVTEKGLKIGSDVGVFALGRSMKHGSFTPPLSFAEQDYGTLGKRAVDILVSQIEDESNKETLFLESRFIFTDSVKNI